MVHALAANTFVVIRIMEPFWFMTALVLVSRRLQHEQEETLAGYLAEDGSLPRQPYHATV